jgi:hypothetical protein
MQETAFDAVQYPQEMDEYCSPDAELELMQEINNKH